MKKVGESTNERILWDSLEIICEYLSTTPRIH